MSKLADILHKVQKPGRYIGEEFNVVKKDHAHCGVSVVLAYPDIYEIGMSYLGLKILYHLLNEREDVVCERVFMPWDDLAGELRNEDMKLFSLESRTPLKDFDIVGFSLSYELTYTNVLSMLELGGIEVLSSERGEDAPLVIAGGACCYNPEPMHRFIDVFVIGDGEEALPALVDRYTELKKNKIGRKEALRALAGMRGVYVPSLYEPKYVGEEFKGLEPIGPDIPRVVEKACVTSFDSTYYPVKQLVPLVKTIHDRISVEIMRGCPNRCRFCQASAVNRPLGIRKPETVRKLCRETYLHTGYERISLLSLSSVNYPGLAGLFEALKEDLGSRRVSISIPSLRVDEAFYDVPGMLSDMRKSGLTFAPETADDLLRSALGKDIDMGILCKSASLAYRHGWKRIKLYFMVGFSSSVKDEAENILQMSAKVSGVRRETASKPAEVKVSVNPFVPKAHTPFQWLPMRSRQELEEIRGQLLSSRSKYVEVDVHDIRQSFLEACMSRGDRKVADIIYTAWNNGARFDGWRDHFDPVLWADAFKANGADIDSYACQRFGMDDVLPWEHISAGIPKDMLKKELIASGLYQ
ncbi:MAG: TIGR03960 family B12-binding radical SAM protein [Candidatus Omnitrophica bacterium]|nr:TIGR03960 family B12-binding radical SAM protein [Candidatus Omnitrophota bacterium]MDD5488373.1 TIGR03960 family B12-binding radical SAM protein [Candidatus Omnitrophota bacterium]